jgi:hypothetical protein
MKTYFSQYLPAIVVSLAVASGLQAEEHRSGDGNTPACVDMCYAGPVLDCNDNWQVMGAAVYQQVRVQAGDVALMQDLQTRNVATTYPQNATTIQYPEDFSWGFKVGVGYRDLISDWTGQFRYNYFKAVTNGALETGYQFAFAPSYYVNRALFSIVNTVAFTTNATNNVPITGQPFTNNNATTVLFSNMEMGTSSIVNNFSFTLERPSLVTQNLEVTPFYGVNTTIITRRQVVVFTNDLTVPTTGAIQPNFYAQVAGALFQNYQKYTWWGVGPMAGVHTSFKFSSTFGVYGDAFGSLTYGQCSTRASTFSKRSATIGALGTYVPIEASIEQRMFQFSPEANFQVGVRYEDRFDNDSKQVRINIGYEASYYFLVMKTIVNDTLTYQTANGAGLGLQGLVISAQLDF